MLLEAFGVVHPAKRAEAEMHAGAFIPMNAPARVVTHLLRTPGRRRRWSGGPEAVNSSIYSGQHSGRWPER
jgi:hypothetical protein